MPRPKSGPYRAFNDTFAPIDYTARSGFPASSWWTEPASREEFDAKVKAEAHRMSGSLGARMVASANYNEKLTAVFGSKSR